MQQENKRSKGEYGYLEAQKKRVMLTTIILYACALIIFFTAYYFTKTRANYFTIAAVLLLLPASKSTVNLIIYLRTPKFSKEIYEAISKHSANLVMAYQLYLTSYQKNFPITGMTARGNNLIGYTEFDTCDVAACEEHIVGILTQNGYKNTTVKIFQEQKKYEERLEQLAQLEAGKKDEELVALMKDISL